MDPPFLGLVPPRLDVVFPGGGAVRPRVAQPAVTARVLLLLLLLLLRSPGLPLESRIQTSADILNESFPFQVLLTLLLTCCQGDGQTQNTVLLTTRAHETLCL